MTAKPERASLIRKLEHEAELRWRYIVRAENEGQIRQLEQILGKPESGR